MSRVGRKRLETLERQVTIIDVIARLEHVDMKPATLYSIASRLGMTPSTHLRSMLDGLVDTDRIRRAYLLNGRGQHVANYRVFVSDRQLCDIPWECEELCVFDPDGRVCVGRSFIAKRRS